MSSVLHTGGPPNWGYTLFQSGGTYFRSIQSAGQPRSQLARTSSSHSETVARAGNTASCFASSRSDRKLCTER
jgi:hypothetical protein